ncbi:MAG: TatA/E family twin arginine-targeting protein translocase [Candidatus Acididesulfobacter diazotrophicus]|uniref:Sec-independent protein translocase protein TatA n=1 Tax=Candidatus Acididesulfobacter diazotrophicus TaxID=2597226 RepID=A0A519BQ80_9DELT|nr:MAG: TatA/E family twin arginine-targeting protein translocase [Candidatus Acididesulfobacter diazotrophicus]
MFGIGTPEIIIIIVVALLVFGPKRLPDIGKSLGKGLREFKKATTEFKDQFNDPANNEDGEGSQSKQQLDNKQNINPLENPLSSSTNNKNISPAKKTSPAKRKQPSAAKTKSKTQTDSLDLSAAATKKHSTKPASVKPKVKKTAAATKNVNKNITKNTAE